MQEMIERTPLAMTMSEFADYFQSGGVFMYVLASLSVVSVSVMIFKAMTLRRDLIVPDGLINHVETIEEKLDAGNIDDAARHFREGKSALARLSAVALRNAGRTQGEVQETVQSSAREEVVKMNAGMSALEVIITIAPLLGLLGTASGLVIVFQDLGAAASDPTVLAKGIARALSTTILGLAIAVPSVIAHSYFSRQIETMSARLEVLLGKMVSACHQHVFFKNH